MNVLEEVPMPFTWHPAYAEYTYLLDWLNGQGPYAHLDYIQVAFTRRLVASYEDLAPVAPISVNKHTLTKKRCMGRAPYVGRPFRYQWWVAVDELGRAIAGDTERIYNPSDEYRYA